VILVGVTPKVPSDSEKTNLPSQLSVLDVFHVNQKSIRPGRVRHLWAKFAVQVHDSEDIEVGHENLVVGKQARKLVRQKSVGMKWFS
jgi:hypothetical protein